MEVCSVIEISREIEGASDHELGQPRLTPLRYDVTWPEEGEAAGLVLVIAGFGDDTASDYSRKLRRRIVEQTGMAAVSVRYHAFESRPANGACLHIGAREHVYLIGLAMVHNLPLPDYSDALSIAEAIGRVHPQARIRAEIETGSGDRQNFGVIQALDHLCVIGDLIEHAPAFDRRRIVALGSSHGAYIAHLMAKFAPSTLAAVIDNSGYVQPPMSFLAIGDAPEVVVKMGDAYLEAAVRSAWTTTERSAPDFYSRDRDLIRDVGYPLHVQTARAAAADRGTQFFMVNSCRDPISPPDAKRRQHAALVRAGFSAELSMVEEGGLDGVLFKSLDHGLGCSLRSLFDRYVGNVRAREVDPDAVQSSTVSYDCVDVGYRISHSPVAPYVVAEVYDRFPEIAEPGSRAA